MISVIIPVKDQLYYTKNILEDIPKKLTLPYEIIVISDNSRDDTNEYLASRTDIRSIIHAENIGVNAAWNE